MKHLIRNNNDEADSFKQLKLVAFFSFSIIVFSLVFMGKGNARYLIIATGEATTLLLIFIRVMSGDRYNLLRQVTSARFQVLYLFELFFIVFSLNSRNSFASNMLILNSMILVIYAGTLVSRENKNLREIMKSGGFLISSLTGFFSLLIFLNYYVTFFIYYTFGAFAYLLLIVIYSRHFNESIFYNIISKYDVALLYVSALFSLATYFHSHSPTAYTYSLGLLLYLFSVMFIKLIFPWETVIRRVSSPITLGFYMSGLLLFSNHANGAGANMLFSGILLSALVLISWKAVFRIFLIILFKLFIFLLFVMATVPLLMYNTYAFIAMLLICRVVFRIKKGKPVFRWLDGNPGFTRISVFLKKQKTLSLLLIVCGSFLFFFFLTPIFLIKPDLETAKVVHSSVLVDSMKKKRVPYQLFTDPSDNYLYATFAHTKKSGFGRVKLKTPDRFKFDFISYPREYWANYATLVPDHNTIIVHSFYANSARRISENMSVTHLINTETFKDKVRSKTSMNDAMRSTYDQPNQRLYVINKTNNEYRAFPISDYIAGNEDLGIRKKVSDLLGFDGIAIDPGKNVMYMYGEGGFNIIEVNTKDFKERKLWLSGSVWAIAIDSPGGRLYLSRPFDSGVLVLDQKSLSKVRFIRTGGIPRSVCLMENLNAVAVGLYVGKEIIIYDTKTFDPIFTVPTCSKVRSMAYNPSLRELYYGDLCGVHYVFLDAVTEAQGNSK